MEYKTPKDYRKALGFTNQDTLKKYFKATDIVCINWALIEKENARLIDMFSKINKTMHPSLKLTEDEFNDFKTQAVEAYGTLKNFRIIEKLFNNNGRARESVYYNWMRGYMVALYFHKTIALVFGVNDDELEQLGEDNLQKVISDGNIDSFKREAIADLQIAKKNIHIEIQAGFTGQNDIKRSKAIDAKVRASHNWKTYVLHFDLFNGKLAVINITNLASLPNDKWTANTKFEDVETVVIAGNLFKYSFGDTIPDLDSLAVTVEKSNE